MIHTRGRVWGSAIWAQQPAQTICNATQSGLGCFIRPIGLVQNALESNGHPAFKAQSEKWAPVYGISCAEDQKDRAALLIQIKRTRL